MINKQVFLLRMDFNSHCACNLDRIPFSIKDSARFVHYCNNSSACLYEKASCLTARTQRKKMVIGIGGTPRVVATRYQTNKYRFSCGGAYPTNSR